MPPPCPLRSGVVKAPTYANNAPARLACGCVSACPPRNSAGPVAARAAPAFNTIRLLIDLSAAGDALAIFHLSRSLDRACRFWENFRLPVDEGQGDPGRRLALDFGSNGAAGQLGRTRQALRARTAVGSGPSDCCVLGDDNSFCRQTGFEQIGGAQRS